MFLKLKTNKIYNIKSKSTNIHKKKVIFFFFFHLQKQKKRFKYHTNGFLKGGNIRLGIDLCKYGCNKQFSAECLIDSSQTIF